MLLASACGGGQQPLDWQTNAFQGLQAFQRHYFAGDTALAEADFKSARTELARTGRADASTGSGPRWTEAISAIRPPGASTRTSSSIAFIGSSMR